MIYNVKDYGAFGNGRNDDTVAIQLAVNAAATTGGTVLAPRGTYIFSASILLPDRVTLTGVGMGQTIFRLADNHSQNMIGMIRTPYGRGTRNVSLRDMTLDGNRDNQTGGQQVGFYCGVIPGQSLSDYDISACRVEIHHFRDYGFDPHEVVTRLTLTDCIAHHNGLDGFTLDGVQNGILRGCHAFNNGRHGFNVVTNSSACLITQSMAYDNGANGFTIQNGSRATQINSCEARGNGADGIYCVEVDQNTLFNNMVLGNLNYGIRLRGSSLTTIMGNLVRGNGQQEADRYSEIMLDDSETRPTTDCLIANNNVISEGLVRAQYGIQETAGNGERLQTRNAFLANRAQGAASTNLVVSGRSTMLDGNL
jgi:parallel beta-helix repeat protein